MVPPYEWSRLFVITVTRQDISRATALCSPRATSKGASNRIKDIHNTIAETTAGSKGGGAVGQNSCAVHKFTTHTDADCY